MNEKTEVYKKDKHGRIPLFGKLSTIEQDQNEQSEPYVLRYQKDRHGRTPLFGKLVKIK